MEREKDQVSYYNKRMMIGGIETGLFGLLGLVYPPASLGMLVTIPETLRQQALAYKELYKKLRRLEEVVDKLDRKMDAHEMDLHDDEPIPPNPETATPAEIEAYKRVVLAAAQQSPNH